MQSSLCQFLGWHLPVSGCHVQCCEEARPLQHIRNVVHARERMHSSWLPHLPSGIPHRNTSSHLASEQAPLGTTKGSLTDHAFLQDLPDLALKYMSFLSRVAIRILLHRFCALGVDLVLDRIVVAQVSVGVAKEGLILL